MAKKKEIEMLITRYRAEIVALEEREEDVRRRIEILENLVPTVLVWYMWKVSQASREVPFPQHESEKEAKEQLEHLETVLEELQQADELLKGEEKIMRKRIEELETYLANEPDQYSGKMIDFAIPRPEKRGISDMNDRKEMEDLETEELEDPKVKFEQLLQAEDTDWKKVCEDLLGKVNKLNDKLKNSTQKLRKNEDYIKHLQEEYSKLEKELQAKIKLLGKSIDKPKLSSEVTDKDKEKFLKEELDSKEALSLMEDALSEVRSLKESLKEALSKDDHVEQLGDASYVQDYTPVSIEVPEITLKLEPEDIHPDQTVLSLERTITPTLSGEKLSAPQIIEPEVTLTTGTTKLSPEIRKSDSSKTVSAPSTSPEEKESVTEPSPLKHSLLSPENFDTLSEPIPETPVPEGTIYESTENKLSLPEASLPDEISSNSAEVVEGIVPPSESQVPREALSDQVEDQLPLLEPSLSPEISPADTEVASRELTVPSPELRVPEETIYESTKNKLSLPETSLPDEISSPLAEVAEDVVPPAESQVPRETVSDQVKDELPLQERLVSPEISPTTAELASGEAPVSSPVRPSPDEAISKPVESQVPVSDTNYDSTAPYVETEKSVTKVDDTIPPTKKTVSKEIVDSELFETQMPDDSKEITKPIEVLEDITLTQGDRKISEGLDIELKPAGQIALDSLDSPSFPKDKEHRPEETSELGKDVLHETPEHKISLDVDEILPTTEFSLETDFLPANIPATSTPDIKSLEGASKAELPLEPAKEKSPKSSVLKPTLTQSDIQGRPVDDSVLQEEEPFDKVVIIPESTDKQTVVVEPPSKSVVDRVEAKSIVSEPMELPPTEISLRKTPPIVDMRLEPGSPSGRPSIPSLAAQTLQSKIRVKDHLIKYMADTLRDLASKNLWDGSEQLEAAAISGPTKTYDFNRNILHLYIKGEEPQDYNASFKSNEDSNPLKVKIVRKLGNDSLLITWEPSPSAEVVGFQIFLNGQFMYWVHSAKRNIALLHPLDLRLLLEIAVSPINVRGDIVSRSIIMYNPD